MLLLAVCCGTWADGTLVTSLSDLSEGTYYIAAKYNDGYFTVPKTTISGQTFNCTQGSFDSETSTLEPSNTAGEFVFTPVSGVNNAFYIYNTNLNKYLVATGSKTFGYVDNGNTNYGYWTFSVVTAGGFSGQFSVKHSSKTHYMRAYGGDVKCYDGTSNDGVYFFRKITEAAYVITPSVNNSSWGSVSLDVNIITATPNDGYRINEESPCTVTSGTATVTRSGNVFTVNATSDCTVQINFEAIPTHNVTWSINGTNSDPVSYQEGAIITFPSNPADINGMTFVGWTTSAIAGTSDTAPQMITSATMGTNDITFYAVFANQSGETSWTETSLSAMTASDVFVFSNGSYAMTNNNGTSSAPAASLITVENGKITSEVADNLKWNVSGNATDGYTFYPNGSTTTWMYCNTTASSSSNNNIRVGDGDRKVWKFSNDGYLMTNDNHTARYLSLYNSQDFRGYTSTSNGAFIPKLYKLTAASYSNYCTTVSALPIPEIIMDEAITMTWGETGKSVTVLATINDVDYTGPITFISSDPTNLIVDSEGNITCNVPGQYTISATIEATEEHQAAQAVCNVTVNKKTPEIIFANDVEYKLVETGSYTQEALIDDDYDGTVVYTLEEDETDSGFSIEGAVVSFQYDGKAVVKATAPETDLFNGVTATYTIYAALNGLADLVGETTETEANYWYVYLNEAQVTYVNGQNGFFEDATGGIYAYKTTPTLNKVYNGYFKITTKLYNSLPEITEIENLDGTITDGNDWTPTEITLTDLDANFTNNLSRQLQLSNITISDASKLNDNINIYKYDSSITFEAGKTYTIIGYPYINNTTKQFRVIDAYETATITLNAACTDGTLIYGTYYSDKAYVMNDQLEGQVVSVDANGKLAVETAYEGGDIVPANTALLIATADEFTGTKEYTITLSTGGDDWSEYNMLKGTLTADEMTVGENCLFYRLTMHNGTTIGFWWGAPDGAAFSVGANKAYLAVPAETGSKIQGFTFGNGGDATSISTIGNGQLTMENAYNLQGQKVGSEYKGIVIVNGKARINK